MLALGCGTWSKLHYFAFLNRLRAGQGLGTPVILAELVHIESVPVTSRQVREKEDRNPYTKPCLRGSIS